MKNYFPFVLSIVIVLPTCLGSFAAETPIDPSVGVNDVNGQLTWYDVRKLGVEGKGWTDTKSFYDRLPARAEQLVRPPVWSLSQQSAGLCVRFVSDAQELHVRWTLTSETLEMAHMPASGVSGVDLYVRVRDSSDGGSGVGESGVGESGVGESGETWRWLANGQPKAKTNQLRIAGGLAPGRREYLMYLPLYNGVTSVEIGLPTNARVSSKTIDNKKPLVFWGTSITQGACASRPGMAHVAILGRKFDRPVINLGFSGNGKMEPEVAKLVAEIDAAVFIIDCLPNLDGERVSARTAPLVKILREAHAETPILLVEDRTYANSFLVDYRREQNRENRIALKTVFEQLKAEGVPNLHYLRGDHLLGIDGEDTVDSSHPNDLGFMRHATAFAEVLRPILKESDVNPRWFQGNLHTHSLWSDGNDFPEMIADWYRKNGYNFLALSDHNVLSQGVRWMKLKDIEARDATEAFDKYVARFGSDWVETRGDREAGTFEVRLKPLEEVRPLVEKRGEFLMIQSEEITDKGAHINATNIGRVIEPQGGDTIRETIQNNLRAIAAQAETLDRPIIPHLNHPNLGDTGISAEELAALVQDEFFEVFNGFEGDGELGSEKRHSVETLWDITSTLRLSEFNAPPMFGLATDDSHHYHGKTKASPGRGWIMLRARHLTPESITRALAQGDFYSSSGVFLDRITFDETSKKLSIKIQPDGNAKFTTTFIGTPKNFDPTTSPRTDKEGQPIPGTLDYSTDVGKTFATEEGLEPAYELTGDELYVRAVVTSDRTPVNPTAESPFKKAWTQPFGWRENLLKP